MKRRFSRRSAPKRTVKRRKYASKRGRFGKRTRYSRRGTPYLRVRRTCYLGGFMPNTTTTAGFCQYRTCSLTKGFFDQTGASIGGLTNLSEYTPLFDLYKLKAYKITLRPRWTGINQTQQMSVPLASATVYDVPYVAIKIDPTDTTTITGTYGATSFNAFLEQTGVRIKRADRAFSIYVKPKITEQYGSGANRYVTPNWTDLSTTFGQDMPHRGYWLYFFTQNFASLYQSYDVFVTYYLQFKGAK